MASKWKFDDLANGIIEFDLPGEGARELIDMSFNARDTVSRLERRKNHEIAYFALRAA